MLALPKGGSAGSQDYFQQGAGLPCLSIWLSTQVWDTVSQNTHTSV